MGIGINCTWDATSMQPSWETSFRTKKKIAESRAMSVKAFHLLGIKIASTYITEGEDQSDNKTACQLVKKQLYVSRLMKMGPGSTHCLLNQQGSEDDRLLPDAQSKYRSSCGGRGGAGNTFLGGE